MKSVVIILDREDVRKLAAILRWGGTGMRLSGDGTDDIIIVKGEPDSQKTAGYACGLDARNGKIRKLILADGDAEVLVWDEKSHDLVKADIKPHNGVLDLRKLINNDET